MGLGVGVRVRVMVRVRARARARVRVRVNVAEVAEAPRGVAEYSVGVGAAALQLRLLKRRDEQGERLGLQHVRPVLGGDGEVGERAHALRGELRLGGGAGEGHEWLDAVALDQQPLVMGRDAKVRHRAGGEPLHRDADAEVITRAQQ